MGAIHIEKGDITTYNVDAIINAANNDLTLGGGVAGVIAEREGPRSRLNVADTDRLRSARPQSPPLEICPPHT